MRVWDLHCDTLCQMREAGKEGRQISFEENELQIDLRKLREGDYLLQCFACFVDLRKDGDDPLGACLEMADLFDRLMETFPEELVQIRSAGDIQNLKNDHRIGCMLTVEEGQACLGEPGHLRDLYRRGVRMMTLTWNYENDLACPNIVPEDGGKGWQGIPVTDHPLTEKGRMILKEMERLHMILDVSHLSDGGIMDVLSCASRPFAASHSNARSINRHVRNLTDDMIRQMGERGCLIGLNYCPAFVDPAAPPDKAFTRARDLALHARHIMDLGGEDILALGSDFDGITGELEFSHAGEIQKLATGLEQEGFSVREIEKIFSGNAMRFFRENL